MQLSPPGFGGLRVPYGVPGLALGRPWLQLQVNLVASFISMTVEHDSATYIRREQAS
jgi:hypothetical protein